MKTQAIKAVRKPLLVSCLLLSYVLLFSEKRASSEAVTNTSLTLTAQSAVFKESGNGSTRMRVDRTGTIYVLNTKDSSILSFDRNFKFLKRVGSFGQGPDDLTRPVAVAMGLSSHPLVRSRHNNPKFRLVRDNGQAPAKIEAHYSTIAFGRIITIRM
jgi:hypothetical protein